MLRAAIRKLPRGVFRFTDFLDNDGVSRDPVRIEVAVSIKGDIAAVDFTGSSPQVAGSVNANYAIAVSATAYVFRSLLADDVPYTAGLLRPLSVLAPEGSVVNARPPAAMAAGNGGNSQRIPDALLCAFAQAAPERIPAAPFRPMHQ